MSTETQVRNLLRHWEELRRQGQVISAEELCRDCPELADELQCKIDELRGMGSLLHTLKPHDTDNPKEIPPRSPSIGPPKTGAPAKALDIAGLSPGLEPIAGYRLIARLGLGGFGEVWKAEGHGGFEVALKFVDTRKEAVNVELRALEIIKSIRHPNLLVTFGAWQTPEFLAIAMELADRTLLDRFNEATREGHAGIPREELLEYCREAAKGIDYLNEFQHKASGDENAGVQHRDIKPHNILIVGSGVKVADFGLARFLKNALTSHTGPLTLPYAAPEFFKGHTSRHSDQYSLAVTYCQLRAGQLPFHGSIEQIVTGHLHGTPDLSLLPLAERPIVARALAKEPNERWPNCRTFVNALQQCAADSQAPLEAPVGPARQAVERRTPQRRLFGLALLTIAALVLVIIGTAINLRNDDQGKDVPNKKEGVSVAQQSPETQKSDAAVPKPPGEDNRNVKKAPPAVAEAPKEDLVPKKDVVAVKPVEPGAAVGELRRFVNHTGAIKSVAFFDDRRAVSAGDDHTIRIWDVNTLEELAVYRGHEAPVQAVAISPRGDYIVSGGDDNKVWMWEVASAAKIEWKGHAHAIYSVAITPDGSRAMSAGNDPVVRFWDVPSGKPTGNFEMPFGAIYSVAFSPKQALALIAGDTGPIRLWDLQAEKGLTSLVGHDNVVWSVAFAPDGNAAVSAGGDPDKDQDYALRLWDIPSGRESTRFEKKHTGPVGSVVFSADGRRALSGSADKTVRLWDIKSGKEVYCYLGHDDVVNAVAISPNGRHALSASKDRTVRVWSVPK